MDLTAIWTFHAALHGVVCLVSLPLAWRWIPLNDTYGYRLGDYRDWPAEKWFRVNQALGRRMAWGTGVLAACWGLLAWYGPVVPRAQFPWAAGVPTVPLLVVLLIATVAARREAQRS